MDALSKSPQRLSWGRHRNFSWRRPEAYSFASDWRSVPVTLHEAADAASCFPLLFVLGSSGPRPHALLRAGTQGHSVFVGPKGQWQAAWLPHRLRAWPFDLLPTDDEQLVLALHEDSDFISEELKPSPIFLDCDPPRLTPATTAMVKPLYATADALPATIRAVAAIADLGLLTPFDGDCAFQRIDREAFDRLEPDAIIRLHRAGALGLVHAAVISQSHLPWMRKAEGALSTARQAIAQPKPSDAGSAFLGAMAASHASEQTLTLSPELYSQCD